MVLEEFDLSFLGFPLIILITRDHPEIVLRVTFERGPINYLVKVMFY